MVDVRLELTTSTAHALSTPPYVKALVRWVTGRRLTVNLLPLTQRTNAITYGVDSTYPN